MVDQLGTLLIIAAVGLLFAGIWAATVAFVCWDLYRRDLPPRQQLKWVALSLLPLIGLALYLLNRRRPLPPSEEPQRITRLKPQRTVPPEPESGTILAAEYGRIASADPSSLPAPEAELVWTLEVTQGPHSGQQFTLDRLPALIGRIPTADIRLDQDEAISRRHAELSEQGGLLWVRDLDSTHGTSVNEQPVANRQLAPGDTIHVGFSTLVVKREKEELWQH